MKTIRKMLCFVAAMMVAVLSGSAAEWEKPIPKNCSLESGQSYYFYNVTANRFVTTVGMKLSLTESGSPIVMKQMSTGDWKMQGTDGYFYSDVDYVGCNGEEEDANTDWYVEQQTSGVYYFRPSKNDQEYSWSDYPNMWTGISNAKGVITPLLNAEDGLLGWYFVDEKEYDSFYAKWTLSCIMEEMQGYGYDVKDLLAVYNTATEKADFEAAIASVQDDLRLLRIEHATESKPYDVTSMYLVNADFTENWTENGHDVPGWTMVPSTFCGMNEFDQTGYYEDNKTLGSWSGDAFGDNKVYQKITGLRNGKYRLGNYGIWIRHTGEEGDPIKGAYIYAKVGDKLYKNPLADTGWWRGESLVEFECREGEAEVGIMFEATNVGQCFILDFKLEYLGEKPASERLNTLIANSEALMAEGGICGECVNQLNEDIDNARSLIDANDKVGQESLFATFLKDYEAAVANKEAYVTLAGLIETANETISEGDSEETGELSDYMLENELEEKVEALEFNNEQIEEIINTLKALIEKAANSVIAAGTDVTDLLVNGHFDTTGGWVATLGDYSIDTSNKILERWWCDWSAEQVLNNVPNGTYRLAVQGFKWCSWDWAQSETDWNGGDGTPTYLVNSKIRLNDNETTIQNVFACGETDIQEGYQTAKGWYVPNSTSSAKKFFDLGLYENVVETTVSDNTLKVVLDCSQNGFWNCFTNLRLIYVGLDVKEALAKLKETLVSAEGYLGSKMAGDVRKSLEDAYAAGVEMSKEQDPQYKEVSAAAKKIASLFKSAAASIKSYQRLSLVLARAKDVLTDESAASTESGKELKSLYDTTSADYESDYPSLSGSAVDERCEDLEVLITKALMGSGINANDDITKYITNPSFENTYGNDETVDGGAHTVPYGWSMVVEGKECHTAQELKDAGINSYTCIEENKYTTDGNYSYCLLSAPVPDSYLYQTIKGLPDGTYRVSVDMTIPYDGGCSRLTGQRLLVNNHAQYYGKPEYYIESELDKLHPEEVSRTFAGYDEVDTNTTGEVGDMGNMQTLSVEVTIVNGEDLTFGVRTDNNKSAMNRSYEENWWDCTGRYKIDNFRMVCVSTDVTAIEDTKVATPADDAVYNLMGVRVNSANVRGIYIKGGKKIIK